MDVNFGELGDWEVLQTLDSCSVQDLKPLEGAYNDDAQVLIRSDHFSLDFGNSKNFTDGSIDELECNQEVGLNQNAEIGVGVDEVEAIVVSYLGFVGSKESDVGLTGDVDEGEDSRNFLSDISVIEGNAEMKDEANGLVSGGEGEGDKYVDDADVVSRGIKSGGGEERRTMVWWKVPFEILRYCVLRTSSIWSVSMAAGMMGFVIFGWRYYSIKRKSRNIQVKVIMDDKKISQFKSRVVRLNEAFSIAKHVAIIRPSLPAAAGLPWQHGLQ